MNRKEIMKYHAKKVQLKDYKILDEISQGKFSRIFMVEHRSTKKLYVAKVFNKNDMIIQKCIHRISWELKILSNINSGFFPKFLGTAQNKKQFYLFMEYFPGGDFFYWEKKITDISPKTSQFYMSQLVLMLEKLHAQKIIYRDLKPENIILNIDGYLRLVDFGSAVALENYFSKTYSVTGTPEFSAPELILNKGHSIAIDLWSLGVMIYEFISKENPFYEKDPMTSYTRIIKAQFSFPKHFGSPEKSLIKKLLVVQPKKRLGFGKNGIQDLKKHPFFSQTDWTQIEEKRAKAPVIPRLDSLKDTRYFSKYKIPKHDLIEVKPSKDPFIIW
jgi:serine/threonine protein kinase